MWHVAYYYEMNAYSIVAYCQLPCGYHGQLKSLMLIQARAADTAENKDMGEIFLFGCLHGHL